jgi:hypothetical protein
VVKYKGRKKIEIEVEISLEKSDNEAAKRIMNAFQVVVDQTYADHVKINGCRTVSFTATTLLMQ